MAAGASGTHAARERLVAFERPRGRNRVRENVGRRLLDSEVLLSRTRIIVLDQDLIVIQIEMLVDEVQRKAVELTMAHQHFSDVSHTLDIGIGKRWYIVEISDVGPLHRGN